MPEFDGPESRWATFRKPSHDRSGSNQARPSAVTSDEKYPKLNAGIGRRPCRSTALTLEWKFSSLLRAAEHGDTEYDLIPITEAEASQIVARIRDARPAE